MLDKMREGSQGIIAKSILILVILTFAFAGVSSYLGGSGVAVAVTVNGQEISQASVEQAYKNERARLQQQYGEQFDLLASNPNFAQQIRAQALQTLVTEALVVQAIDEMGLRVGDDQIKEQIRQMPEFQVDGKFNNEQYLALLRRASYTPAQFSGGLKQDAARRQLLTMLIGSEFVLPAEVDLANELQAQQRIAKVLTVSATDFTKTEAVTESEIQQYYAANSQRFQYPEQVSVDYVVLDATSLTDQVAVTDGELETYFDNHQSDYKRVERRKVAHILVKGDSSAAKEKAELLLAELKKGADFGKLATQKSDDAYSAKNSGLLDWFEAGVMDPDFDTASFALTKDAPLSALVKSSFGYHIIKLMDIQESQALPFAEVKAQVKVAVEKDKTSELYYELQQQLSEVAFESPDNLDEAAGVLNSDVLHAGFFSADKAPKQLADKAVLRTLFDLNFREEGMNSELIELAENKAIVVRVNEYKEAATRPLAEVSAQIEAQLNAQKARSQAELFANSILSKLKTGEPVADLLNNKNIKFSSELTFTRYSRDYDYQVIQQVFKLAKPAENAITRDMVTTSTGDYAIIELSKVVDSTVEDKAIKDQVVNMLTRSTSEATYQALVAQLMENADINYTAVN